MARLVVFVVEKPKPKIVGLLKRHALAITTSVYAGSLPRNVIEAIWSQIEQAAESAALILQAKNELGIVVRIHGDRHHSLFDQYGIALIAIRRKTNE
jgi:CRISPR-associated endoribonuclease Cas2 subtype I-E